MNLNRKHPTGWVTLLAAPLLACAPVELGASDRSPRPGEVERHLAAMGTGLTVLVEADTRAEALAQSELAVRAVEVVEARLSTWRKDSELSRLNAQPSGAPASLSRELAADLHQVERIWTATAGAFDPALGRLVEAWDLRSEGRVPRGLPVRPSLGLV